MMEEAKGRNVHPTYSIEEFVNSLETPRKILIMVKAGAATDATIALTTVKKDALTGTG